MQVLIFSVPLPYFFHIILMSCASVLFVTAWITVRYLRKRSWWLKAHRILNTTGVVLVVIAFIIIFSSLQSVGSPHFFRVHGIMGLITTVVLICTPVLAQAGLKLKKKFLIKIHPWLGRVALILVLSTLTLGILQFYGLR